MLWNGSVTTIEMQLRELISHEQNRNRKSDIHKNVQKYMKHFSTSTSFKSEGCTQIAVHRDNDNNLFLSLFPNRSQGDSVKIHGVFAAIERSGLVQGEDIDVVLIEKAYATIIRKDECVWRLPISVQKEEVLEDTAGDVPGRGDHSNFLVGIFDVDYCFKNGCWSADNPLEGIQIVKSGELIGRNFTQDMTVFGWHPSGPGHPGGRT